MLIFFYLLIFNLQGFDIIKPNAAFHEFHLSKCEIEFNENEKTLEISLQLFIDDTELALASVGHDSLRLFDDEEDIDADTHLQAYIAEHFKITVDDTQHDLNWHGKEISEDLAGLWCYMTIDGVSPTEQINVSNNVLMELFDDQRNIVKLKYNRSQKAYFLFDTTEYEGTLTID